MCCQNWGVQRGKGRRLGILALVAVACMPSIGTACGDTNGDGVINGLDIDPFVDVLLNGPYDPAMDYNEDGAVNGLDVDPFVSCVIGGGTTAVPEPSTLLLALIAMGVIGGWRMWGG